MSKKTMIRIDDEGVEIGAETLAEGLGLDPSCVQQQMREGQITSRCERGVGEDEGRWRLTFFSANRRLRLIIDAAGRIVHRSAIDFGDRPLPQALHGSLSG